MQRSAIDLLKQNSELACRIARVWQAVVWRVAATDCRKKYMRSQFKRLMRRLALLIIDCCNPFLSEKLAKLRGDPIVKQSICELVAIGYCWKRFQASVFAHSVPS